MNIELQGLELRATVAASILGGLLASAPLCDRTKINKRIWVKVSLEWADVLLEHARKKVRT